MQPQEQPPTVEGQPPIDTGAEPPTEGQDMNVGAQEAVSNLTKNRTRFTYWNSNDPSNDSSQMNLSNVTYKTISVSPTISSSQYFPSGSTTYYMPMREF